MSRRRWQRAPSPRWGYDIHTSSGACGGARKLTPFVQDSDAGADDGPEPGRVWGRAAGKRGAFLCERLVAHGGRGVSVRLLGGGRAGEMRITRFLHNPKVTVSEMTSAARERTCAQVAGRHVLAIQDTSALRVDEKGVGVSFHPVIAVDANAGMVLGLVDNLFLTRQGGEREKRRQKSFDEKDSRRGLRDGHRRSRRRHL
jgi:hypothetical protein